MTSGKEREKEMERYKSAHRTKERYKRKKRARSDGLRSVFVRVCAI